MDVTGQIQYPTLVKPGLIPRGARVQQPSPPARAAGMNLAARSLLVGSRSLTARHPSVRTLPKPRQPRAAVSVPRRPPHAPRFSRPSPPLPSTRRHPRPAPPRRQQPAQPPPPPPPPRGQACTSGGWRRGARWERPARRPPAHPSLAAGGLSRSLSRRPQREPRAATEKGAARARLL